MKFPVLSRLSRALKPLRRRAILAWLRLTGRNEEAAVRRSKQVPGMFHHDEARLLYRTVADAPGPGDIAEIGSWRGRTSVLMGHALRDAGITDCRIYAIDHHMGSDGLEERIARKGSTLDDFRRNIEYHRVRDLVEELVMPAVDAAKVLSERGVKLRLAFIDGAHDEESVRQDIRSMLPLVQPGGLLAFHDYDPDSPPNGFPGVHRAVESELDGRVEIVMRAQSLLVTRLKPASP